MPAGPEAGPVPREADERTRPAAAALLRRARSQGTAGVARLRILDGPLAGQALPLALAGDETLGRGRRATLRIPDPAASRLHLRLLVDARTDARAGDGHVRALAQDLGSRNGALLNGRRLRRPRALRDGDVLSVGSTRLRLEVDGASSSPAPSAPAPHPPIDRRALAAAALLLAGLGALLLLLATS